MKRWLLLTIVSLVLISLLPLSCYASECNLCLNINYEKSDEVSCNDFAFTLQDTASSLYLTAEYNREAQCWGITGTTEVALRFVDNPKDTTFLTPSTTCELRVSGIPDGSYILKNAGIPIGYMKLEPISLDIKDGVVTVNGVEVTSSGGLFELSANIVKYPDLPDLSDTYKENNMKAHIKASLYIFMWLIIISGPFVVLICKHKSNLDDE